MTYTRFPKPTLFPSQPTFPQVIHSQHTTSRRHLLVSPLSLFAVHLRLGGDGDGASGDRGASRECGLLSNPLQGDAQRDPVPHEIPARRGRSEEHTSDLQSLMRISYAVFCLKNK